MIVLGCMDLDLSLRMDKPASLTMLVPPMIGGSMRSGTVLTE